MTDGTATGPRPAGRPRRAGVCSDRATVDTLSLLAAVTRCASAAVDETNTLYVRGLEY